MNKLAIAAALIALAAPVYAATITIDPLDRLGRTFINIDGDIENGDAARLQNMIPQFIGKDSRCPPEYLGCFALTEPNANVVVSLSSNGGNVGEAIALGELIRAGGWTTYVADGHVCASTCALAFLAGTPRAMAGTARIGFHQAADPKTGQPQVQANTLIGMYLGRLGYSYDTAACVVQAPPSEVLWLTKETAERCGISIDAIKPPRKARQKPLVYR